MNGCRHWEWVHLDEGVSVPGAHGAGKSGEFAVSASRDDQAKLGIEGGGGVEARPAGNSARLDPPGRGRVPLEYVALVAYVAVGVCPVLEPAADEGRSPGCYSRGASLEGDRQGVQAAVLN